MAELSFRLRLVFQKRGRLRFLSHLEVVRALERIIRRARLPYAVSNGFNVHMRHAPGPALPVGTSGLDERFDVWLTEYLSPEDALNRLRAAGVDGLEVIAASYANPRAKGLQATHVHEVYELALGVEGLGADGADGIDATDAAGAGAGGALSAAGAEGLSAADAVEPDAPNAVPAVDAAEIEARLARTIAAGSLTVARKKKHKTYDLTQLVERAPTVRELTQDPASWGDACHDVAPVHGAPLRILLVTMELRSGEQGSLRPEVLLRTALNGVSGWRLLSITRTRLYADSE